MTTLCFSMSSPFFSSGLAMWSPAPVANRSLITATVTPTPLITMPVSSFHHKPVYDPPACLVCGLPHPVHESSSYLLNDQSTISTPEPNIITPHEVVVFRRRSQGRSSILASCAYYIRSLWKRFVYQKRLIHPAKRRYR
ncbi:hypothetical protein BJV82DRAFT_616128 [Fennellomyces sp. T-0311]|nr:hypothetical protein BJV82DRAFT_616128 [Fennellomyces sp. T-0311]